MMASNAESSTNSPSFTTADEWKDSLKDLLLSSGAVEETREKLTSGTYADGGLVKLAGVTCVGKTIHTSIFATDNFRKQFSQKCLELSGLRHPHLVQLLGVQISDATAIPPVLVFEHLPLSLAGCLQKYSHIPDHAAYTILLEVSLGLRYLHEQKPPLVHGHLNAHNVLFTEALHVKLSDVVRFGASVPSQPNTPYHPPEEAPTESGDIFNFGDLILHISLQREPSPLKEKQHPKEDAPEEVVTLSELERREKFISELGESPLRELASSCLQDEPSSRPNAASVAQEMEVVSSKHPPEHKNILDMFAVLGQLTLTKETVASLNRALEAKQEEIEGLKDQIEPLKLELESKDQVLAAQKQEVDGYKQALLSKEGRIKAYETGLRAKEALAKAKDREITAKKQDLAAKDNLLKAAHNRIEVLEHQVSSSKKKMVYPPRYSQSPGSPGAASDRGASPQTTVDDTSGVVLRRNKGRLGRGNISSDGYMYQGFKLQRSKSMSQGDDTPGGGRDPVLAKIFARQQQKISDAESLDAIKEKKAGGGGGGSESEGQQSETNLSREARAQSSTRDEPTPELKRILDKRKSFLDDDEN